MISVTRRHFVFAEWAGPAAGGGMNRGDRLQSDRNWGSVFIFIQNPPENKATLSDKTNTPNL